VIKNALEELIGVSGADLRRRRRDRFRSLGIYGARPTSETHAAPAR
jgi:hypothetical protein